jgi:predicted protein tyrosine phosphatase
VFAEYEGLEVLSAGTDADAVMPVSRDLIEWAEVVMVMENHHRDKLRVRYGKLLEERRVVVLRIRDEYRYMDGGLVEILKERVLRHLGGMR